jgi:hypothetical protein
MVTVTLGLLIATSAGAATRYAAPGGAGHDPCANPAKPCSVYTAAARGLPGSTIRPGDVVELAPGIYHAELEGEFGYIPSVLLPKGVTVRGQPGEKKPLIVIDGPESAYGAFVVPKGSEVADVEIRDRTSLGNAIVVSEGIISRVIARSIASEPTCLFTAGTMRDSACFNSGGGPAIGVDFPPKGDLSSIIRNSTLIATGPGSVGMAVSGSASKTGMAETVDALGVIIKGEERDLVARAQPSNRGPGAAVSISLRASDYATIATETPRGKGLPHRGKASITPPGTHGNVTAPPLLAADNLHQLPGSPTIDRGIVDSASEALDVDGEPRTIGEAPDTGADERDPLATTVDPIPVTVVGEQPPPKLTTMRRAEFIFGSSEPGSHFECKLDHAPFRACSSPYEKRVRLGRHEFQVRAVDPQGQADRTPVVFRWRVVTWRECPHRGATVLCGFFFDGDGEGIG